MYGDAFVGSAPAHRGRDTLRIVGVAIFAALLSAAAGAVFVAGGNAASWYPSKWDARVAPIAEEVAKLRGLDFVHPVRIHYLAPDAFEKQLGAGDLSADDRAEVTREESVFRALGFIGGKTDLLQAYDTSETSGVLAYYDPDVQEIFVRGTTLDVAHRVTIAHEMTHVLQDQHFDLRALQKRATASESGDSNGLKALVEGDAVRIQEDYLKQLSTQDQKDYDREDAAEGDRVGKATADVPEIVDVLQSAPYEWGPQTVRMLIEAGGNSAVNDALVGATPSTSVLLEPGDVTPPVLVNEPLLPSGGTRLAPAETFGPFETFLTLAQRLDPAQALTAADLVAGGRGVSFRSKGTTCYRVVLAPTFEHSRSYLQSALQQWADGRSRTTIDANGDLVGFTVCDPGTSAPAPSTTRFHDAVYMLSFRAGFTVSAARGHVSGDVARCAGRVFVQLPGAEKLVLGIGNKTPTDAQTATLRELAQESAEECRADPDSGLG